MVHTTGRVTEMRTAPAGLIEFHISCPDNAVPAAGQYLLACDPIDPHAILSTPLFLVAKSGTGFWASPLSSCGWQPGTLLDLWGPHGHGFDPPKSIQRLGLAALGDTAARLIPLVTTAGSTTPAITLFTDLPLPRLPALIEVYPLAPLKDGLDWADFMALDVPIERFGEVRGLFGLGSGSSLPCPAQVLVTSSMPCAGLARCGVCAVRSRKGWKLACEDGPVFDLNALDW